MKERGVKIKKKDFFVHPNVALKKKGKGKEEENKKVCQSNRSSSFRLKKKCLGGNAI